MRKRKWLSFLLAVMMLVSAAPFSSVTAGAADGTVEVSTWDELKRALDYTTNCSVVKVIADIETKDLNGHTGLHQNNIIFMTMKMDKVLDLNGHTVNAYVKYYSEVGQGYAADKNIGTEMLNWLRGPRPLNGQEISFLNDRFRDGKTYLPFTYFSGSTPENNYTPTEPYTIVVESNHVSGEEQGYMKLFIPCGGADDPRPIKMRQRGSDGKWFLWEQYLLTGVRTPKSADPWA